MRRFVAPGKVVVLGEYAVLDGAPAVVAAVDVGVSCTWTPADTRRTRSDVGDTRFVDAALEAVDAPAGTYVFAAHNAPRTESKPGLGGSAAATVVATFAGLAVAGIEPDRRTVFRTAYDVHHRVQGSGSGVDVAASTWGGMLRYHRGEIPTPLPTVSLVVVWSGSSAKTGPRVAQYQAWEDRDAFVRTTSDDIARFADDPVAALRSSRRALEAMAEAAGITYRTPALDRIVELAEAHGGGAKPSGAGGGDCAVAVLPDPRARSAFVDACIAEGFAVPGTRVAAGVHEVVSEDARR